MISMRIIIGGAGRVGTDMARALRAEDMDVVLVDSDSRAVKNAQNLDVLVIHGDLTTRNKLHEAGMVKQKFLLLQPILMNVIFSHAPLLNMLMTN